MPNIVNKLFESSEMPIIEEMLFYLNSGYTLNKQGYRCDEFNKIGDLSVVTVGCSNTFGWTIAEKDRFSDIFIQLLHEHTGKSIINWNIGEPAKSNDYIARQTLNAINILKPNIVLICWTEVGRREYFPIDYDLNKQQQCYNHLPAEPISTTKKRCPHYLPYVRNFKSLTSHHEDEINLYKNIKLTELALEAHNIHYLTSSCDKTLEGPKYVGQFHYIDKAADDMHPGPVSNRSLGQKFFKRYQDVYMATKYAGKI